MLFLGTEKYPDENSYSAFLNQHGGNSNAYTASEYTNYYFDVQASFLEVPHKLRVGVRICPQGASVCCVCTGSIGSLFPVFRGTFVHAVRNGTRIEGGFVAPGNLA
jgi:hypothetical protein